MLTMLAMADDQRSPEPIPKTPRFAKDFKPVIKTQRGRTDWVFSATTAAIEEARRKRRDGLHVTNSHIIEWATQYGGHARVSADEVTSMLGKTLQQVYEMT